MASRKRKSTDNIQRKAVRQVDAEIREISPQEKRRQFFLNVGVWLLVIVFCMTSGIMCFSIGDKNGEQNEAEQSQTQQRDEIQTEIDRYTQEVGADAQNIEALANLGYYWLQKGLASPKAEALKKKQNAAKKTDGDKDESKAEEKPEVSQEEAFANARTYLTQALKIDQNHIFAKKNLADLDAQENHFDSARKAYNEILAFCKEPVKVKEGEDETSIQVGRNNQRVDVDLSLAQLNMRDNKAEEAIACLDDAISVDPGNIDAYSFKAGIYGETNQYAKAHEAFKSALAIAVNMGEMNRALNLYLGDSAIYRKEGRKDEAKKSLEKARDLFPENAGGQAAAMRGMLQQQIDELDGKKPAPAAGKPAGKAAPADDGKPRKVMSITPDAAPAEESKPAEEAAPAEENKPAEEAAPAAESKSAEEAAPAAENKPAEEAAPAEDRNE